MRHAPCLFVVLILAGCATGGPPPSVPAPVPISSPPPSAVPESAAPAGPAEQGEPPLGPPEVPAALQTTPARSSAVTEGVAAQKDETGAPPARRLTTAELATLNDERLIDVYRGMSREAVERIMDVRQGERPLNPFGREWLRTTDGRRYEVIYYLTREPRKGRAVSARDLTPVIFQDDKVYAIGHYPLKKLKRTACTVASPSATACLARR
jgi:hypothetical protein